MMTPERLARIEQTLDDAARVRNHLAVPAVFKALATACAAGLAVELLAETKRLREENARLHETLATWEDDADRQAEARASEPPTLEDTDLEPTDGADGPVKYNLRVTTSNPERIRIIDLKRREAWRFNPATGHFHKDTEFGVVSSIDEAEDFYDSRRQELACYKLTAHLAG